MRTLNHEPFTEGDINSLYTDFKLNFPRRRGVVVTMKQSKESGSIFLVALTSTTATKALVFKFVPRGDRTYSGFITSPGPALELR